MLFDVNGYIAGIQSSFKDNQTNGYPPSNQRPPFAYDGKRAQEFMVQRQGYQMIYKNVCNDIETKRMVTAFVIYNDSGNLNG